MGWQETIAGVAELLRGAEADILDAEAVWCAGEMQKAKYVEESRTRGARLEAKKKLIQRMMELRARRELLLTAPPNTPGAEAALKRIEMLIKSMKSKI